MELIHIKHSSFLLHSEKALLLFDYYVDNTQHPIDAVLGEALQSHVGTPLYIFVSHSHFDHYSPEIFKLFQAHPAGTQFILHEEVRRSVPKAYRNQVHFLDTGEELNLNYLYIKAYGSTDLGGSFYVKLPDNTTLFHAGDLNNWHWNEEADQVYINQYEEHWYRELDRLVVDKRSLDLLMFPTDLRLGKDYLKGLSELLQKIPVRKLAPMHINGDSSKLTGLKEIVQNYHIQLLL